MADLVGADGSVVDAALMRRQERRRVSAERRRIVRRRRLGAAGLVLAVATGSALAVSSSGRSVPRARVVVPRQALSRPAAVALAAAPASFALPSPVERELALVDRGKVILAGGLDAGGHSTSGVYALTTATGRVVRLGHMPQAFHDAAGAIVSGRLLVFGGGPETGTSTVQSFDLATGYSSVISHLPLALSDLSAATVAGTVYLVGGFDGVTPQRTIYATRDGRTFRPVGALPIGLRYPAVVSDGSALVIAGGISSRGPVSSVYRFDPAARTLTSLGHLPARIGHASAFSLAGRVYVAGGLDSGASPVDSVTLVDAAARRIRVATSLPRPISDAAAVALGPAAWLIGGSNGGAVGDVVRLALAPRRGRATSAGHATSATASNDTIYAATAAGDFSASVRGFPERVYVPNSRSGTVDVIDPKTFRVIRHFGVGLYDQHITPSWDMRHLYVNNTAGNSLTVIDPRTSRPIRTIPVTDPYNLYFTPDGRSAIVVVETFERLDFRNPRTLALQASVAIPAAGPNHLDFSADGSYLLISAEFSGDVVKVDLTTRQVTGKLFVGGSPVDVKLAPDGRVFFVANQVRNGVSVVDPATMREIGFIHTGAGAHGFAYSRDARRLFLSNRLAGTISVLDPYRRRVNATWRVGGSPDMLQVSPDGSQLWVSNRFNRSVFVINTATGHVIHTFKLGDSPHGLAYFPQPGRYSLGHNGVYR
jgi:YVTN family beta-propeller protein